MAFVIRIATVCSFIQTDTVLLNAVCGGRQGVDGAARGLAPASTRGAFVGLNAVATTRPMAPNGAG